ncbi:MAG: phospho-N-acetylmuramoyl-pentapeptide-transferase [Phycisphaerae bacterium]
MKRPRRPFLHDHFEPQDVWLDVIVIYHLLDYWLEGKPYAYQDPLFRGACAALFCFLVILVLAPPVIDRLLKWKVGDRPEFDHATLNQLMHGKANVPTMGGVLVLGTIALAVFLLCDLTNFYVQLGLACLVWLTVLGGVDDWLKLTSARRQGSRDGLKTYEKLLFQIGLGVLIGFYVYNHGRSNFAISSPLVEPGLVEAYKILSVPFYKVGIQLGALAFMFVTVLVTTGTSNAVNLTDGMDGLAAGCVAICSLVFAVLTYIVGNEVLAAKLLFLHVPQCGELVVFCGSICGACLGFLWYNCYPAKVFLGDTGSLPLGGLIGYVAVVTRQELMLLIAGGVFVIEALSVMTQVGYFKFSGGQRVLRCAPIHHHFHLGGWSETQTVVRFWLVAAMFASFALATIKLR